MTNLNDAMIRSTLMSERIRHRTDRELRELITNFSGYLNFRPLDDLMISEQAWQYIDRSGIQPRLVFAHPGMLREHPGLRNTTVESRCCLESESLA